MLIDMLSGRIDFTTFLFGLISILVAIAIHEFSHAFVANSLGDPTARMQGRLTLDPSKHLDSTGSLLMVLFGFGWGKPVPINPTQIKNGRTGVALVSLAGPLSNIILAVAIGLLFRFGVIPFTQQIAALAIILMNLNLGLAIFNLLPFGPLDGYKIALGLLPPKLAFRLTRINTSSQYMMFLLIIVFLFDPIYRVIQNLFLHIVLGI